MEHLPQVRWIATRIFERLPASGNIGLEDLISTGVVGLINAIDSFDPSHNAKLKTYAEYKIRGAILDSIRGMDGIAPHKRRRAKEIEAAIVAAEQRLGRAPTEEEIAAELGMGVADYQDSLNELKAITLASLDAPVDGKAGSQLASFVADQSARSPNEILEQSELRNLITEGLRRLPPPERLVLTLYYKEELNMREIAPIMNLHLTRISQLKSQGILRLRSYVAKRWPAGRGITI